MIWRFLLALTLLAAPALAKGKHAPKTESEAAAHRAAIGGEAEASSSGRPDIELF